MVSAEVALGDIGPMHIMPRREAWSRRQQRPYEDQQRGREGETETEAERERESETERSHAVYTIHCGMEFLGLGGSPGGVWVGDGAGTGCWVPEVAVVSWLTTHREQICRESTYMNYIRNSHFRRLHAVKIAQDQ